MLLLFRFLCVSVLDFLLFIFFSVPVKVIVWVTFSESRVELHIKPYSLTHCLYPAPDVLLLLLLLVCIFHTLKEKCEKMYGSKIIKKVKYTTAFVQSLESCGKLWN